MRLISRLAKLRKKVESKLLGLESGEKGILFNGHRVSVWGDGYFWKYVAVLLVQHCE